MSLNARHIRQFEKDLNDFSAQLNVAVEKVVIKIALDLHAKISRRNPVDTGRSRASWDIKEGSPSDFLPPEGTYRGAKPQDGSKLTGRTITFVTSAVHYVEYLEKGSSKQAPAGMIDISLAEVYVEIDNFIAKLQRSSS